MLNFTNVQLDTLIVHNVGNKQKEEPIMFSDKPLQVEADFLKSLLMKYFLSPFKNSTFYHFFHETDIHLNELFTYCSHIFKNNNTFFEQSINIAKHLHESASHPKIKGGELYIVLFRDCMLDDEVVDAVGLFKTENKETYLKINQQGKGFEIGYDDGININKLDKGCLIFNTEQEDGYLVAIVDSLNKSNEALYWKDDFLKIKPREDDYFHTKTYLDVCKGFIEQVCTEDNNVAKTEQIQIKNDTVKYFTEKDNFEIDEFEEEVLKTPEKKKAFRDFKQTYSDDYDLKMSDSFEIEENAAKKAKKDFKNVLKLDKNFHIYVHGDRDLIDKGFDDERQKKYYTFYFEKEE